MATKKEIRLYGDSIYQYKPTIRMMIQTLVLDYFAKKRRYKESVYKDGVTFSPEADHLKERPLVYMAIVNEGIVSEMIRMDNRTAELMNKPKAKVIPFDPMKTIVKKGMVYKSGEFKYEDD